MKAFQVTQVGWEGLTMIYAAEDRNKAIALALHSARESGYKATWLSLNAKRAPEHDMAASRASQPVCLGSSYAGCRSGCLAIRDKLL